MPNSFTSIVFATDATEAFFALTERALERSEKTEVADGTAWRWACPSGAELWQHVDQSGRPVGLVPYFDGNSVVVARLDARVTWPDRAAAIGGFQAFALWFEGDDSGWAYPFVFEAPDFPCHAALDLPAAVAVRIAAFAEAITVHASVAAYRATKAGAPGLASQAVIPCGMFEPGGTPIEPPQPTAIINGHVRQARRRVNSLSGHATIGSSSRPMAAPTMPGSTTACSTSRRSLAPSSAARSDFVAASSRSSPPSRPTASQRIDRQRHSAWRWRGR